MLSDVASIYATDFHIGWGANDHPRYQKINEFIDYIEEADPVLLGLIGDEVDLGKKNWPDILVNPTWIKLQNMVQNRSVRGRRTLWIHGNHDYSAKPQYLPGAELVHGKITVRARTAENPGEASIILIHGWQWDIYRDGLWARIPGLTNLLFQASMYFPNIVVRLNKLYSGLRTPFEQKQIIESKPEEKEKWNLNMIFIHGQARQWALKQRAIVIFGHTHFPDKLVDEGGTWGIINAGDWIDSFSYIIHEKEESLPELRNGWKPED